jgi:hypothetical protein
VIEVGAEYKLTYGNGEDRTYVYGVVKAYEHPLIKFVENSGGKERIINLGSLSLISAEKR